MKGLVEIFISGSSSSAFAVIIPLQSIPYSMHPLNRTTQRHFITLEPVVNISLRHVHIKGEEQRFMNEVDYKNDRRIYIGKEYSPITQSTEEFMKASFLSLQAYYSSATASNTIFSMNVWPMADGRRPPTRAKCEGGIGAEKMNH